MTDSSTAAPATGEAAPPGAVTDASAAKPDQQGTPPPEDLGDAGKRAIELERKARRDAEARLKELEPLAKAAAEKAEAEKSELTKATEAMATERDARTKAEAALLRYQVGAEKGVPAKLVPYLTGATKEEIEASADVLLGELNGSKPAVPGRPTERMATGEPSTSLDDEDPMTLVAKARGQDTKR